MVKLAMLLLIYGVDVTGSILRVDSLFRKWHQLSRVPVIAWVGAIRRESTRQESVGPFPP